MINDSHRQDKTGLWSVITKLDKSKINTWLALRNALGVAISLAFGFALGHPLGGVAAATGALNVAYSDGSDPYLQRGFRMLLWSFLGAFAIFIGSLSGSTPWLAILLTAGWAFIAGLLISISTRAGDLGLNTLVTVIVYGARGANSAKGALVTALLALGGGLIQTLLALLLWPVRRYDPERRAIGGVYLKLATSLSPDSPVPTPSPLETASTEAQDALKALGRDHTIDGERFRLLLDQADRLRMSTFLLGRLVTEMKDPDRAPSDDCDSLVASGERLLLASSELLSAVGSCLLEPECKHSHSHLLAKVQEAVQDARKIESAGETSLAHDLAYAMDVLAGQLRIVTELTARSLPDGLDLAARSEARLPWKLRFNGWLSTLIANLDPKSAICRHAIRLAVCVSAGGVISRMIGWQRSYWIPMTIAVVLKPDFTTTFSRGVLRLAGTSLGLALATVLYHIFPPTPIPLVALVGLFTLLLRSLGPANYGIFSIAISALIVFLIAAIGVPPATVVALREVNTLAGGIFALLAYALWPTWERTQIREALAAMLDSTRDYFHVVCQRFVRDDPSLNDELDRKRAEWRRARSSAEASVDRVSSEPNAVPAKVADLYGALASSSSVAHAIIGLEAGFVQNPAREPVDSLLKFSRDVEFTLYFLAAGLRGSKAANEFPKLRQDHSLLLQPASDHPATDEFLLLETDRLTVSLNTLREQIARYLT